MPLNLRHLWICILLLRSTTLLAQDSQPSPALALEAGFGGFSIGPVDRGYIRDEYFSNVVVFDNDLTGDFFTEYVGARVQWLLLDETAAFSTGLRYTATYTTIRRAPYFFFLHGTSGTTTDYLAIKKLAEQSHYVGVPIEISTFFTRENGGRMYVRGGCELSYRIATSFHVDFHTPSMEMYEADVEKIIGKSNTLFVSAWVGGGVRMGPRRNFTLGFSVPFVLSKEFSSINEVRTNVRLELQYVFGKAL
jgi:hypothetical protein